MRSSVFLAVVLMAVAAALWSSASEASGATRLQAKLLHGEEHATPHQRRRRPPSNLWYRVRVQYSADQEELIRTRPGTRRSHFDQLDGHVVRATLAARTSVLLRKRSGRRFSILLGRPLRGTLAKWNRFRFYTAFGCTPFTLRSIGTATNLIGSIGALPAGRNKVEMKVNARAEVSVRTTEDAWTCNRDVMEAAALFPPEPNNAGRDSPPGVVPRTRVASGRTTTNNSIIGSIRPDLAERDLTGEIASGSSRIVIDGVRFGARSFRRRARVARVLQIPAPPDAGPGSTSVIRVVENWTFSFRRCPGIRPC